MPLFCRRASPFVYIEVYVESVDYLRLAYGLRGIKSILVCWILTTFEKLMLI
jgi:hypothetical protein